jgi:pimeloyl-ACP methyl ester carboxylesterase
MKPTVVPTHSRLHVAYSIHESPRPESDRAVVLHHGICHTREHFGRLIEQLNALGIHAAMIDQQSEQAGLLRNCIGAGAYREGMAAAVREIEKRVPVGSYALHSMGALVGEAMQQRYADLRRPTLLLAPVPVHGALPITLRILRRRPLAYFQAVLTLDILSLAKTPEHVRELFFDPQTPESIVHEAAAQLKHAPFWIYCQMVLRWMLLSRIRDDGQPKRLLYSETDEIFHPGEYTGRYRELKQIPIRGGHDFFIQYADEAARLIAEFHVGHIAKTHAAVQQPPPPHDEVRAGLAQPVEGNRQMEA